MSAIDAAKWVDEFLERLGLSACAVAIILMFFGALFFVDRHMQRADKLEQKRIKQLNKVIDKIGP